MNKEKHTQPPAKKFSVSLQEQASVIRVLSYNIHKGFDTLNRQYVLYEIRDRIRESGASIGFLQELCGHNSRHPPLPGQFSSQLEYLADTIWPHFAYGKNAVYSHGHHGNAILSELPFEQFENIDVSSHRFAQRGILHGVLATRPKLHLICIHFGLLESERKFQAKQLCLRIREKVPDDEPLLVAGDFNDWNRVVQKHLREELHLLDAHRSLHGKLARTFPSWLPLLALDRIYYRGLEPVEARTLKGGVWKKLSDHLPLLAEFRVQPGTKVKL